MHLRINQKENALEGGHVCSKGQMKDSFYSHIIHVFRTLRALGGGGGTIIVKTRSHIFLQVRALHNIFDSLNIKESLFFFLHEI